jgi:hypothetical protein
MFMLALLILLSIWSLLAGVRAVVTQALLAEMVAEALVVY